MIARSPTVWYSAITIDKGSDEGVRVDQPAMSGSGLVGKVSDVAADAAPRHAAHRPHERRLGAGRPERRQRPRQSDRRKPLGPDPRLRAEGPARCPKGATVITSGWRSSHLESLFPRGIPIGKVTQVDSNERELYQRVHLRPFADLRNLDVVEVLTRASSAGQKASARPMNVTPGTRSCGSRCWCSSRVVLQLAVVDADHRARRRPGPLPARGALGRPARGPDPRRDRRLPARARRGHGAAPDARRDLAAPDRGRLSGGPLPRAARRLAQARAGARGARSATLVYAASFALTQFLLGVESRSARS